MKHSLLLVTVIGAILCVLPQAAFASAQAPTFYHINNSCFTTNNVTNGTCNAATVLSAPGNSDPIPGNLHNYPAIQRNEAACANHGYAECNLHARYQSRVCPDFGGTGGCMHYSGYVVSTTDTSTPNQQDATYGYGVSSGSYAQWYALVAVSDSLAASPTSIDLGVSATLNWTSSQFVNSGCTIDNGVGSLSASKHSGSVSVSPQQTTTYTLTCTGASNDNTGDVGTATATATVIVTAPDFIAGAITPTSATAGTAATFTADITNQGTGNAGATTAALERATDASGSNVAVVDKETQGSENAGVTRAIAFTYTYPNAGTWYMRACADKTSINDVNGTVVESNENNNCGGWTKITVTDASQATSLPNLTALSTTVSANPVAGKAISFSSSAKNVGAGDAGSFPNIFQVANSAVTSTVLMVSANTVSSLASNATAAFSASTASLAAGAYNVRACANTTTAWTHPLSETSATDNCGAWTAMTVQPCIGNNCGTGIPGYCATHPTDPSCIGGTPGYCAIHPSDPSCTGGTSGYCAIHPSDPSCTGGLLSGSQVSALLSANPLSVIRGDSTTLTWSSQNAVSCAGTGTGFGTKGKPSGTTTVTPSISTLFTVDCQDASGNHAYDSQTVTVTAPEVTITASPTLVRSEDTAVISWSVKGAVDSCSVSGPGLSSHQASGSAAEVIPAESSYTISCVAGTFNPTASVTVKVIPSFKEF